MPFDPVQLDEVTRLLIGARELIATKGWIKNEYKSEAGYCMLAAIMYSCDMGAGLIDYSRTINEAAKRLRSVVGTRNNIAYWNDRQDSVEAVLAAFDAAIAKAI